MGKINQNFNFYVNGAQGVKNVLKEREKNLQTSWFFLIEKYIDRSGELLADHILLPVLKGSYSSSGALVSKIVGIFSASLKKKVENAWFDPFTTELLNASCGSTRSLVLYQ